MSEDLSKLTDRELSLLILHEVRSVRATLDGLAQSVGRDVGRVAKDVAELRIENTRDLGKVKADVELARNSIQALRGVVTGADFLAHDRVEQLESRVEAIEKRPRLVNGGE